MKVKRRRWSLACCQDWPVSITEPWIWPLWWYTMNIEQSRSIKWSMENHLFNIFISSVTHINGFLGKKICKKTVKTNYIYLDIFFVFKIQFPRYYWRWIYILHVIFQEIKTAPDLFCFLIWSCDFYLVVKELTIMRIFFLQAERRKSRRIRIYSFSGYLTHLSWK